MVRTQGAEVTPAGQMSGLGTEESESGQPHPAPPSNRPPSQGAGGKYSTRITIAAMAWLVINLLYYIAPAAREGFSWARANLHIAQIIVTLSCGLIVGWYIWGKAQLLSPYARALRSVLPSRRHPATNGEHGRELAAPVAAREPP